MTSLSPRKPRTTAPWKRAAGKAVSLAALLALTAATAAAQRPDRAAPPPQRQAPPGQVLHFHKPAEPGRPAAQPGDTPRPLPTPVVVQPAAMQPLVLSGGQQPAPQAPPIDEAKAIQLPPRDRIFSIPDDATLERVIFDRLRQDEREARPPRNPNLKYGPDVKFPPANREEAVEWLMGFVQYGPTARFPPLPDVGGGIAYKPKTGSYPPSQITYQPLYVMHRRLHFEELNAERYGWDLGIIQPLVSTMYFYKDVLLWPNSVASGCAYGFWDTSAGKCLPGSPTPYFLYPPGLTITGGAFEGVIITGAAFIVP